METTDEEIISEVSRDIKVLSEVEKIWINYDDDGNGTLDSEEIAIYLKERFPHLSQQQIEDAFKEMDENNDGQIDKHEMFMFVKNLYNISNEAVLSPSRAKESD